MMFTESSFSERNVGKELENFGTGTPDMVVSLRRKCCFVAFVRFDTLVDWQIEDLKQENARKSFGKRNPSPFWFNQK